MCRPPPNRATKFAETMARYVHYDPEAPYPKGPVCTLLMLRRVGQTNFGAHRHAGVSTAPRRPWLSGRCVPGRRLGFSPNLLPEKSPFRLHHNPYRVELTLGMRDCEDVRLLHGTRVASPARPRCPIVIDRDITGRSSALPWWWFVRQIAVAVAVRTAITRSFARECAASDGRAVVPAAQCGVP